MSVASEAWAQLETELYRVKAQLAACAASPWRYDVENAPKDGSEIYGKFTNGIQKFKMTARWEQEPYGLWKTDVGNCFDASELLAFAAINPPEVTP